MPVSASWIRIKAKQIFKAKYPSQGDFVFSMGWFNGFQRRWGISRRRITKIATKCPKEYVHIVNEFLKFVRRNSQSREVMSIRAITHHELSSPPRRFIKPAILNLDETPIPFEYLDGYTYELKGSKTVAGKSARSGWDKRQATLVVYIWADGEMHIKPKLIFHGAPPPRGQIYAQEGHLYSKDVTVEFNETAYNNEELFLKWLNEELFPVLEKDTLLVMDAVSFHKTKEILDLLKAHRVTPALIPPGCTSLLQPLDTHSNRMLKQLLREETDQYVMDKEAAGIDVDKWTTSERRIMTTFVVANAIRRLQEEHPDLIHQSFIQCGLSVRPDGREDHLIRIKGIPNSDINLEHWESAVDPALSQEEVEEREVEEREVSHLDDLEYTLGGEDLLARSPYRTLKVPQLKEHLRARGLPLVGTKMVLVKRLEDHDKAMNTLASVAASQVQEIGDAVVV
jgi:hypothetical protein